MREKVIGTVIKSKEKHMWEVLFDYNGISKVVSLQSLSILQDSQEGVPLNELRNFNNTYLEFSDQPIILPDNVSICFYSSFIHIICFPNIKRYVLHYRIHSVQQLFHM